MSEATSNDGTLISDQEAAIYDRQIRLWGVEAQRRLRSSMILFCGFRALNAEICKNLVLSGVSVTLQDSEPVEEKDLGANFFLNHSSVGKNRAHAGAEQVREMNPLVKVDVEEKAVKDLTAEDLSARKYTLVCAGDLPVGDQLHLNKICREASIPFFSAVSCGFRSYMFCDLGAKTTVLVKEQSKEVNEDGEKQFIYKEKHLEFPSLEASLAVSLKDLSTKFRVRRRKKMPKIPTTFAMEVFTAIQVQKRLEEDALDVDSANIEALKKKVDEMVETVVNGAELEAVAEFVNLDSVREIVVDLVLRTELSPVCAVVGGIVGQELLKAISGKDEPVDNFFFFDGFFGSGVIRRIG